MKQLDVRRCEIKLPVVALSFGFVNLSKWIGLSLSPQVCGIVLRETN